MSLLEQAFYGAGWDETKHPRRPAGSDKGGALSHQMTAAGWVEEEHPRWPVGHPEGGKFRPKDAAGSDVDWDDPVMKRALEDAREVVTQKRHKVKVGQAKHLREEIENWYFGTIIGYKENGQKIHGVDPKWQSILDNWGDWTTEELYALREELARQLREKGEYINGKWETSGLLSGEYAREVGRSLTQARNEARRLYEAVDKALTIEQFGLERAQELYPELFETKTPKPKAPDPRDQGIPEIYLSGKGTFKPGFDAKLKSDLVNSALGMNPQKMVRVENEVPLELRNEVVEWWKERNSDEYARNNWPDDEIWKIAKHDPMMTVDLSSRVYKARGLGAKLESTLLHRFEPDHALKILEERGWSDQLWKRADKHGLLLREPPLDDVRSREILERVYGTVPYRPDRGDTFEAAARDIAAKVRSEKPNIEITGWNIARVQETVGEAAEISDKIHKQLADRGVQVYFGPPESTDLDEMWQIRDEKARNGDRRTMKQVAGFYSPSQKRVIISADNRYGSTSLATHELGHAMGDVFGVDHDPALRGFHAGFKKTGKLGRYYLQNGNDYAGAQELWAEGVGLHYYRQRRDRLGRAEIYPRSGPFKDAEFLKTPEAQSYMDWVADTLKMIEAGTYQP